MSLISVDFKFDQYADFQDAFPPWLDATGTAIVFTGATGEMIFYTTPNDPSPLFKISTTPSALGSLVFGPVTMGPTGQVFAGVVQPNVTNLQTALMFGNVYQYVTRIFWPGGIVTPFASGRIWNSASLPS